MSVKIYELQRGDKFSVPQAPGVPVLTFDHMDGMYCYATTDDGQVCNIAGWTECQKEPSEKPRS